MRGKRLKKKKKNKLRDLQDNSKYTNLYVMMITEEKDIEKISEKIMSELSKLDVKTLFYMFKKFSKRQVG